MSEFMPDFHKLNITESDGLLLTVLIGLSFRRRDVYFELHKVKDRYKLYWCFEHFIDEIIELYKERGGNEKDFTMRDFLNSKEIQELAQERTNQNSCYVSDEDKEFFSEFLINGLPSLDRNVPLGLDGHHYDIRIKGNPDRNYYAWCVIPKEWSDLRNLIELLRKYANLGEMYSVQGMA